MGLSFVSDRIRINGVIDTSQSALQNLQELCTAAATWLTYDAHQGKWAFVINNSGTSSWSFNNSNIIGGITVSSTGIKDLYNGIKVSYPDLNLQGQKNYLKIQVPAYELYPKESEHILDIDYGVVNSSVQAQVLGLIQLKQNRMDQVITFTTDYSRIGVKAGDIIDVTNDVYGFIGKLFRVITVKETDGTDGTINLQIIALEYDDNVYNDGDITKYELSDSNGIISQGSFGQPGAPGITTTAFATQPSITITSTAPTGGLIDGMEFWWTTDTTVTPDSARTYTLLTTVSATAGTYYSSGTVVKTDYAGVIPANFIVKTRAVSGLLTSPFSYPSTSSSFTAVQFPTVIKTGTAIVDSSGNPLGTITSTPEIYSGPGDSFVTNDITLSTAGTYDGRFTSTNQYWKTMAYTTLLPGSNYASTANGGYYGLGNFSTNFKAQFWFSCNLSGTWTHGTDFPDFYLYYNLVGYNAGSHFLQFNGSNVSESSQITQLNTSNTSGTYSGYYTFAQTTAGISASLISATQPITIGIAFVNARSGSVGGTFTITNAKWNLQPVT